MDKQLVVAVLGAIVLGVIALAVAMAAYRGRQWRERRAFIDGYAFPSELRRKIGERRPELTFAQIDLVLDGLRSFFRACLAAQSRSRLARQLGMPSRAVDEAWHEFILMTEAYAAFCGRAFGRYLHHAPEGQMQVPMRDALANTLHFVRNGRATPATALAGAAAVPLLFAIDRELGIADGYVYDAAAIGALDARRQQLAAMHGGADGGDFAGGATDGGSHGGHCDGGAASCDGGSAACGGGCGSD